MMQYREFKEISEKNGLTELLIGKAVHPDDDIRGIICQFKPDSSVFEPIRNNTVGYAICSMEPKIIESAHQNSFAWFSPDNGVKTAETVEELDRCYSEVKSNLKAFLKKSRLEKISQL